MAVDVNRALLPEQVAYVLDIMECGGTDIYEEGGDVPVKQLIKTNDVVLLHDGPRQPGESIDWHVHMPTLYQIMIVVQGWVRVHYKVDDSEVVTRDVGEGQVAYLPGGIENKFEIVGDVPASYFVIEPDMPVNRVEHLVGEDMDVYDPSEQPVGLHIDTNTDTVHEVDEDALIEG